jgi:ribosome assembly protein YihI (activator of Der GTPase)
MVAHATKNELSVVGSLLRILRQSDKKGALEEEDEAFLRRALHRFKELMRRLCFEQETPPRKIVEEVTQDLHPSNE